MLAGRQTDCYVRGGDEKTTLSLCPQKVKRNPDKLMEK